VVGVVVIDMSIEPSDPGAFAQPYERDPRLRFDFLPLVATAVLAILEIWAASFPGNDWNLAVGAFLLGIPVTVMWLFLIVDRLLWRHVIGWQRILLLIVSLPAIALGTLLILDADLPLRARVAASDTALRALVTSDPGTRTVGLFDVVEFWRTDFGFEFLTPNAVLFGDCGLAYSPTGSPESGLDVTGRGDFYDHIDGPWYRWCTGFD
jgi:hypothetical protein